MKQRRAPLAGIGRTRPRQGRCGHGGRSGQVLTNGPVLDAPDEGLRGIAFFTVGSVDRARELAVTDPAVVAGRLEVEAMTWWCPPGTMARPGAPVTAGD